MAACSVEPDRPMTLVSQGNISTGQRMRFRFGRVASQYPGCTLKGQPAWRLLHPMDKSVIRFSHCGRNIYCFSIPERCPQCGVGLGGRRLEEAPVSIPTPFSNGHKAPCSFLVAPTEGNFVREFDGGSDLHTGISNTNGVVCNYTKTGVRRDECGWERCISVPLVQPDTYNLINQWDQYLDKFSSAHMWDTQWQRFDEENHNCYNFTLTFINCVLATQGKRALSKDEFTNVFVLPRIKRASKYSVLCREIAENDYYIVMDHKNQHGDSSEH